MSYTKIKVNKFDGLNSEIAPELVPDGAARDIMNFRMEKIGKLVSRDGVIIGLFTNPTWGVHASGPTTAGETGFPPPQNCFIANGGIIGIGELVLEEKWTDIDTDRMMVYCVRGVENSSYQEPNANRDESDLSETRRNFECYLFSPLDGQYKNYLLTNWRGTPSVTVMGKRDAMPQGKMENSVSLYAPNRYQPNVDNTDDDNCHWINHYVDMKQYRSQLVISDRVNGDMILEDEYTRRDANPCEDLEHELHLRPNALQEFDIDTIRVDSCFGVGRENDEAEGVENGMALYKYRLPKKTQIVTSDHHANTLGNEQWVGYVPDTDDDDAEEVAERVIEYMKSGDLSTMIMLFNWKTKKKTNNYDLKYTQVSLGHNRVYTFTNAEGANEFSDLTGKLELVEEEFEDEDGNQVSTAAASVYVWDDFIRAYYPCLGVDIDSGNFLREVDRFFTKLSPGARITKLSEKENAGKYAPLGVWRYKFVWDFGGGVYSAPSAELLVPDIMWSAVRDDDGAGNLMVDSDGDYVRPQNYDEMKEWQAQHTVFDIDYNGDLAPYRWNLDPYKENVLDGENNIRNLDKPKIYNDSGILTGFGEQFFVLKEAIYGGINHKYGVKDWASYSSVNGLIYPDQQTALLQKGDFATMITVDFGQSELLTKGTVWEGIAISYDNAPGSDGSWGSVIGYSRIEDTKRVVFNSGSLRVPIFQTPNVPYTYDSVFDDHGRMRFPYVFRDQTEFDFQYGNGSVVTIPQPPIRCIVFPRYNHNIGLAGENGYWISSGPRYYSVIFAKEISSWSAGDLGSSDVYLNFFPITGDKHNDEQGKTVTDGDYLRDIRPNSILRAVKTESEKLSWTKNGINSEALSRLVLSGTCEMKICSEGDPIHYQSQWQTDQRLSDLFVDRDTVFDYRSVVWSDSNKQQGPYYSSIIHLPSSSDDDPLDTKEPKYAIPEIPIPRQMNLPHNQYVPSEWQPNLYNFDYSEEMNVYIYGNGERFIGMEQLTSYFPSSLLFGAPRLALRIKDEDVPRRAKRLMIFRTKSSHSNDFQPNQYGLVEELDVERIIDEGSIDLGKSKSDVPGEDNKFLGVYYFDEIRDQNLDFTRTPSEYEGLRTALKSRFNIPLNERVYYLNFIETYQPIAPRAPDTLAQLAENADYIRDTHWDVKDSTDSTGFTMADFPSEARVQYKYVYKDVSGVLSVAAQTDVIDIFYEADGSTMALNRVVVLYYMPSTFENYIDAVYVYRAMAGESGNISDNAEFRYIGKVLPEDEGVFVDNFLDPGDILDCTDPSIENYESGCRWSEPFKPDFIKYESFSEYRSGDGMQITGAESQYGNILILKETSMHRVTVQARGATISRTDEITPELGAISPNAVINVNNTVYFLSWKGFMSYDNNVMKKVDGPFAEELQFVMANASEAALRDAACGYNPHYNEIYLNVPMLETINADDSRQYDYGEADMYGYDRKLYGHIYVINLDRGYATKFAYRGSIEDVDKHYKNTTDETNNIKSRMYIREITDVRQMIRKYYTDSLGELRSGDILGASYGSLWGTDKNQDPFRWAGIYIESPYESNISDAGKYTDYDETLDGRALREIYVPVFADTIQGDLRTNLTLSSTAFPPIIKAPIQNIFKSKFFTGEYETVVKRVRKVLVEMFSKGSIKLRGTTIPIEAADERISNEFYTPDKQEFLYQATVDAYNELDKEYYKGTQKSTLSFVPRTPYDALLLKNDRYSETFDDYQGKPIRISVEVEAHSRTQINEIGLHWRPIHTYLG